MDRRDVDADFGAESVTSEGAGENKFGFSSLLRQMLYETSVGLGVGSLLANFDRSSFCIPRGRSGCVSSGLWKQKRTNSAKRGFAD